LLSPATARTSQTSYLGKQATKQQTRPRHAGRSDTPPVIAGGLRENIRISIARD
jgi:hypothetical protein